MEDALKQIKALNDSGIEIAELFCQFANQAYAEVLDTGEITSTLDPEGVYSWGVVADDCLVEFLIWLEKQ